MSLGNFIVSAIKAIGSGIWSFFSDPIGSIISFVTSISTAASNILSFLGGLVKSFIDALLNLFKLIFIPDDGWLDSQLTDLQSSLNKKVNIDSYKTAMSAITNVQKVVPVSNRLSFMGATIDIDIIKSINDYRSYTDWIIRAIAYYCLLQYNINNVYKLIRGGSLDDGGDD